MGINVRALVCTMLAGGRVVCSADGRQEECVGQRRLRRAVEGDGEQWARDCSSFLQGKEELGVEKALFSVALLASWGIVGEADMAGASVSKRALCDGAVGGLEEASDSVGRGRGQTRRQREGRAHGRAGRGGAGWLYAAVLRRTWWHRQTEGGRGRGGERVVHGKQQGELGARARGREKESMGEAYL